MVFFGGLLGLIGLATLVFRDADVVGLPAVGVGAGLVLIGAVVAALGVVRRTRVRRRRRARGEPEPIGRASCRERV